MKIYLILISLVMPACAAQTPISETFILQENSIACASRSIRGYERDPCTTYRLVCYPDRFGTCLRSNQQ